MSLSQYDLITQTVVDALATLANSKLSPSTPYLFTPFRGKDAIGLPPKLTPVATYGTGSFSDGQQVVLWLFPYKTISGNKTYAYNPVTSDFKGVIGSGNFSLTWTWVSPIGTTAPDGYVAAIVSGLTFLWKDIGNVETLTESGALIGWISDFGFGDNGANNTPCSNAIWLKVMNQIHSDFWNKTTLFGGTDITFDDTFILSGPWCVSLAQKCYLELNGVDVYKNLKFLYSESDSTEGNQLACESDMLAFYFNGVGGIPNNLDFSIPGKINGRIMFFSNPINQNPADWTVTFSPTTGITYTFIPSYTDPDFSNRNTTAFAFDLVDVPYVVGTPLVFTLIPPIGFNIISDGTGGKLNIVLTGEFSTFTATDTKIIHPDGPAGKSVALANNLPDTTFSDPETTSHDFASHWRSKVDGVFVANTIPTLGPMPYLDQDLPQYTPQNHFPADTRRVPLNGSLPYIASVNNRGALWPIFRDTDFTPDSLGGQPFLGSKAWQSSMFSKYIATNSTGLNVEPSGITSILTYDSVFVADGTVDLRVYNSGAGMTLYVKKGDFPTVSDFDATAPANAWFSLAASIPGFETGQVYYFGLLNPTSNTVTNIFYAVTITDLTAPNGTLFPTDKDSLGVAVPITEGFSFFFSDSIDVRLDNYPIPLQGYCVYSVTVRRMPIDNGSGVFLSPSTGTSALNVKLGLMSGFGWATSGIFTELQTVVIPAGQSEIVTTVFWPVLSGAPLVYQCTESVKVVSEVNFQPMMHSKFQSVLVPFGGGSAEVGYWNGVPWFDQNKAMLCFQHGFTTDPVILPISASVVNDLTAVLNLLP